MSVAVAVLSGSADAGLGIFAAAKALDLDFIPVVTEQYDLVIPAEHYDTENIRILLDTIVSAEFKKRVQALGGYSTQNTGATIDLTAS
jgi:putative molybdopterin biosynthesis protein